MVPRVFYWLVGWREVVYRRSRAQFLTQAKKEGSMAFEESSDSKIKAMAAT